MSHTKGSPIRPNCGCNINQHDVMIFSNEVGLQNLNSVWISPTFVHLQTYLTAALDAVSV